MLKDGMMFLKILQTPETHVERWNDVFKNITDTRDAC